MFVFTGLASCGDTAAVANLWSADYWWSVKSESLVTAGLDDYKIWRGRTGIQKALLVTK